MVRDRFPDVDGADRAVLPRCASWPATGRWCSARSTSAATSTCPTGRMPPEDNPAMGWRALRMALDRPAMLRSAAARAARGARGPARSTSCSRWSPRWPSSTRPRQLLDMELGARRRRAASRCRARVRGRRHARGAGAAAGSCRALLPRVDFLSIGSNDLIQFLFACDRGNPELADRYDVLSPPVLSFLRELVERCRAAGVRARRSAARWRAGRSRRWR